MLLTQTSDKRTVIYDCIILCRLVPMKLSHKAPYHTYSSVLGTAPKQIQSAADYRSRVDVITLADNAE